MTKIISYNINGIRAAIRKGLIDWLKVTSPDIICFQEIKAFETQFDLNMFKNLGYKTFCNSAEKPGYSGVAIFSKMSPNKITTGMNVPEIDKEGRVIKLDFENFSVINSYFPSGTSGEVRQAFKMKFLKEFENYVHSFKDSPIVVCGDFNICHKPIDIHNPLSNKNSSGFLPEERQWMTEFLEMGFIDSFRKLNNEPHNYTWWSYRANSRNKNLGWRIDYHMLSKSLNSKIVRSSILSEVKHSDHCPILLELNL